MVIATRGHRLCNPARGRSIAMNYQVVPGRRTGDGWLVVVQKPDYGMDVIRSFATWAEAKAEATRLAEEPAGEVGAPAQ